MSLVILIGLIHETSYIDPFIKQPEKGNLALFCLERIFCVISGANNVFESKLTCIEVVLKCDWLEMYFQVSSLV